VCNTGSLFQTFLTIVYKDADAEIVK